MSSHTSHDKNQTFVKQLNAAWQRSDSMLCIGLDPDVSKLPKHLSHTPHAIEAFCLAIIDATAEFACAFKPQIAYFSALGAEKQLENIICYIKTNAPHLPVILDAKRGDIGATAQQYAREAFVRYGADAVTLSPYMGSDSIEPYFDYPNKGLFLLCRTSNPGGSDLQFLETKTGEKVFERVARFATQQWNPHQQTGLVVGATFPEEIAKVRSIVGNMPLLVPGIGAQGGDAHATVKAGKTSDGYGLLINSSRAILYADSTTNFALAAAQEAKKTRDLIRTAANN
jgi:orotidine-5'-phosphate decarboxylase